MSEKVNRGNKIFYGWKMFPAVWIIYFIGCGPVTYGLSVVLTKMVLQNGWDERAIGWSTSVYQFSCALMSFAIIFFIRKFGYRLSMITGSLVGAAGFLILSMFPLPVMAVVAMMFTCGFCNAFTCLTPCPGLINNWFDRRKSLPMSLVLCAGAAAGFVMPLLAQGLSGKSVSFCWMVYCLITLVIAVLALLFVREKPEDIGEVKDGKEWCRRHPMDQEEQKRQTEEADPSLGSCYRSGPFFVLAFHLVSFRGLALLFTTFAVIYGLKNGCTEYQAALLLTLGNICGLGGRLLAATLSRVKIPYHYITAMGLAVITTGGISMAASHSFWMLVISCGLIGGANGFLQAEFPLILPGYFGNSNFSGIYGLYNTVGGFAGSLTLIAAVAIINALGSYRYGFLIFAGLTLISLIGVLFTPEKKIGS